MDTEESPVIEATPDLRATIDKIREQHPWHPLPDDYPQLTRAGQKKARIAAMKNQSTPMDMVAAWDLFRRLYLKTQGESFYKGGFVPSPEFHFQSVHDIGQYPRNALAAPRGFAKSTVIGAEIPLFLTLTRPNFDIVLCLATDKLVEGRFDKLMQQLTSNKYIIEDFGTQKPKRGEAVWNHHHLQCLNGSSLEGFSVTGRKRGARPRLFLLDDPEFDPQSGSESAALILIEKFETFLFRQVIPMLEYGSSIFWVGTMISRRSYLYHACRTEDPRFRYWNRRVLSAIVNTPGGLSDRSEEKALWKEKWPTEVLAVRRSEIGNAAYAAEYDNDPTSDEERLLHVDPSLNEYRIPDAQPNTFDNPLASNVMVEWDFIPKHTITAPPPVDPDAPIILPEGAKRMQKPMCDHFGPMFRILTVDYAPGLKDYNDYSCIVVSGFDPGNCLWVLDAWMGRVRDSLLLDQIYRMGVKWQVRIIGVEALSIQISLVDSVAVYMESKEQLTGWSPRVIPVRYPSNSPKSSRIAALEWRFNSGRIKYPMDRKNKWPFDQLYAQTQDFTPDLALLQFDDIIDTVAMTQYVVHSKGGSSSVESGELSLNDRLRDGIPVVPGIPLLSGINANDLTGEQVEILLDKYYKNDYNKNNQGRRPQQPRNRLSQTRIDGNYVARNRNR